MPYVKWVVDGVDVVPGLTPPIGKNVLVLKNIQRSKIHTVIVVFEALMQNTSFGL